MKKRITIEDRILIENLLKLNYKLKDISNIIECEKTKRFPFVCNGCSNKTYCRKKKYYYNYVKTQENYNYILKYSRTGIDMSYLKKCLRLF